MAGEIYRVQTADGVNHLIDYMHLANRPDTDSMAADISSLQATVAAILDALRGAGIVIGGASVDGSRLSLAGSVSGRTLTIPGATVSDGRLSLSGGGSSVGDGVLTVQGSVSGRRLTVTSGSVSDTTLTV